MALYEELPEVESQLAQMGISVEGISAVVRAAISGFASTTNFHPKSAPGTYQFHEANAALRRLLVPNGFRYDDEDGQPRTFSTERGVSIIVQAGDENTGRDTGVEPRNRNPHGEVTQRKIRTNDEQLVLPIIVARPQVEDDSKGESVQRLLTWVLLLAVIDEHMYAELSLPKTFASGRVTQWVDRILLPTQPFGESPTMPVRDSDDDGPEAEVAVEWK